MCRRSKNLRRRLHRHRLEHLRRRCFHRHRHRHSASRHSDRHQKRRLCSASVRRPRANPRRAAKYLQLHSDRKRRFVRRSNPSCHPRNRRTNRPIHLPNHRRLHCRRPAIHRSCHPTSRRHSGRRRNPDCRLGKKKMKNLASRHRRSSHPSSSSHRSNRRWACCSMNRLKIRRRSIPRSRMSRPMNRRNRRSACSKASTTTRKIAAAGSRPSERRTPSRRAHIGRRASADAWTSVTIQAR